jgi:phosphoribosylanthranilate isomerase
MFVKICGLTTPEGVDAALAAGADAIGVGFAPSVRRVTPAEAAALAVPARGRALCVAVTLHPTTVEVEEIFDIFSPDLIQTDIEDVAALSPRARARWLPVLREGAMLPECLPERVLYEGAVSGTGRTADWARAQALAGGAEVLLAGGLNPGNVGDAIRAVRPWGVDVSSGVESTPGTKSPSKITDFVAAARAAATQLDLEKPRQ